MPANALAALLPKDGSILVEGGAAASSRLAAAAVAASPALGRATFTGIQIPGINRENWLGEGSTRFATFFMTPELAKLPTERVAFQPLSYTQILRHLRRESLDAAIFSVTPPDAFGRCSFGPSVDLIPDLWETIPVRIGHVNPLIPRTDSPTIPIDAFDHIVEALQPLQTTATGNYDALTIQIANLVACVIPDRATLQIGLGTLPNAALKALAGHKQLAVHSGLISDEVLDLLESGAIPGGEAITAGVAIGSSRLYDALPHSGIRFRPVSITHDWATIAQQKNFISINSAVTVDLYGQAYSEILRGGWSSGAGGAPDFARGAALGGHLRIVALPSSAHGHSRIVPGGRGLGPVTLSRHDIDLVVTEYGVADLRGGGHDAHARALISIAHPEFQEELERAWLSRNDR